MKKLYTPLFATFFHVALTLHASCATFVIGDGFALDGSGSFGIDPTDNPSPARDPAINNAEITSTYDLSNSQFDGPFGGTFDPTAAGFVDGRVFRSGHDFDLSQLGLANLPPVTPGFQLAVTDIEVFFEISGATFDNRLMPNESVTVDIHVGDVIQDVTLPAAVQSFTVNGSDTNLSGAFFPAISLDPSLIDINNDTNFEIVLSAGGTSATTGVIFGSSQAPGVGITGTDFVQVAPALRITVEEVAIPEPSVLSLFSLLSLTFLSQRRRRRS